jgi:hypothetical protein
MNDKVTLWNGDDVNLVKSIRSSYECVIMFCYVAQLLLMTSFNRNWKQCFSKFILGKEVKPSVAAVCVLYCFTWFYFLTYYYNATGCIPPP